jgi:hypothetical protein
MLMMIKIFNHCKSIEGRRGFGVGTSLLKGRRVFGVEWLSALAD